MDSALPSSHESLFHRYKRHHIQHQINSDRIYNLELQVLWAAAPAMKWPLSLCAALQVNVSSLLTKPLQAAHKRLHFNV